MCAPVEVCPIPSQGAPCSTSTLSSVCPQHHSGDPWPPCCPRAGQGPEPSAVWPPPSTDAPEVMGGGTTVPVSGARLWVPRLSHCPSPLSSLKTEVATTPTMQILPVVRFYLQVLSSRENMLSGCFMINKWRKKVNVRAAFAQQIEESVLLPLECFQLGTNWETMHPFAPFSLESVIQRLCANKKKKFKSLLLMEKSLSLGGPWGEEAGVGGMTLHM